MIQIFSICDSLSRLMADAVAKSVIVDYRVYLRKNENLYLYILTNEEDIPESLMSKIKSAYKDIEVEIITSNLKDDSFYVSVFAPKEKIVYENGRRRNSSIWSIKEPNENSVPVVSFYSYKGGMGRTTTLVAYASYLAIHHGKKCFYKG